MALSLVQEGPGLCQGSAEPQGRMLSLHREECTSQPLAACGRVEDTHFWDRQMRLHVANLCEMGVYCLL